MGAQTTETLMALKAFRHLKGFWALEHSRYLDTWALKVLEKNSRHFEGYLSTWTLETLKGHLGTSALGHSGTWVPGHSKDTLALWHSSTWVLEALKALYLADPC